MNSLYFLPAHGRLTPLLVRAANSPQLAADALARIMKSMERQSLANVQSCTQSTAAKDANGCSATIAAAAVMKSRRGVEIGDSAASAAVTMDIMPSAQAQGEWTRARAARATRYPQIFL